MKASSSGRPETRWRSLAWMGVVGLITVAVYGRSCGAPFQFDDYGVLAAREQGNLDTASQIIAYARTRVVPFATLGLNYWVGGEDPSGYHAVNLAIHLIATWLVFGLALTLCQTPRLRGTWLAEARLPFAVAAALLFACHPIQVQAVTYVVQRASSMAAAFYIGSVLCYLRARNAQVGSAAGRPALALLGSLVLALAAFLSKENAASLPLVIVSAEWVFYDRQGFLKQLVRLVPYLLLVLVIAVGWLILGTGRRGAKVTGSPSEQVAGLVRLMVFRANPEGDISPVEYLFTQATVIPRYLRLVVVPWGFNIDPDIAVERELSPAVVGGLIFLAALFGCGLYAVPRWPVVGFGILWSFGALSVESSLLPIRDVMAEHRMYLAMPGIALAVGNGFAWLFVRRRTLALAAAVAVVAVLGTLTVQRNELWRDPLALWSDALAKSPNKARVHVNVGMALQSAGRFKEAIDRYCSALAIDPKNRQARSNLDIAVDEEAEGRLDSGEEIVFEAGELDGEGEGAELKVAPPDPCHPR